jgi:hypothetical protein
VTDIATGWTENRSVPNKARKWVVAALEEISKVLPFPLLGIDSDNGSELINYRRAERHSAVTDQDKTIISDTLIGLNPAAIQRRIQALSAQLLTLTTSKASESSRPALPAQRRRASTDESTTTAKRAS